MSYFRNNGCSPYMQRNHSYLSHNKNYCFRCTSYNPPSWLYKYYYCYMTDTSVLSRCHYSCMSYFQNNVNFVYKPDNCSYLPRSKSYCFRRTLLHLSFWWNIHCLYKQVPSFVLSARCSCKSYYRNNDCPMYIVRNCRFRNKAYFPCMPSYPLPCVRYSCLP